MSDLAKLREAADYLLNIGKYKYAYDVYSGIYQEIMGALGSAQSGMNDFSRGFLNHNIRTAIEFNNSFTEHAASSLLLKWFDLDYDQVLIEFIFVIYGKIQCINKSEELAGGIPPFNVYNEYLALYTLILYNPDSKWVSYLLKLITPVLENNRFKKVRYNISANKLDTMIADLAAKIKNTEWEFLNGQLLKYMDISGRTNSKLYNTVSAIHGRKGYKGRPGGSYSGRKNYRYSGTDNEREKRRKESESRHDSYEKNNGFNGKNDEVNFQEFTDAEKSKYFGEMLGLKGKVTKSQIRKVYYNLISQYHPDKVADLGEEIRILADKKTKEINIAFQWLKEKYNI